MYKRMIGVFCVMLLMMTGIIYRIYYINASDYLTMAAQVQGKYRMEIATARGGIYDRNMRNLVNDEFKFVASVLPTPQAATVLMNKAAPEDRESLLQQLSGGMPFAVEVPDNNLYAEGIELFRVPRRYGGIQYAPHLVGYLEDGGIGVAGLERAFDPLLTEAGGDIAIRYQMDASGRMMQGAGVAVQRTTVDADGGVVLTLDKEIQRITQTALADGCDKGAAVVLDVHTGDILAMASLPVFDQNDIAASLTRDDAPFINRATSGYSIGSVFKVLVAAAALENGIGQYYSYECVGYTNIGDQVFKCNNDAVHGVCDMERALEVSCNSYFIDLAAQVNPALVVSLVSNLGLGKTQALAEGISTQPGNLPTALELSSPAVYANFSFGQGSSLASPLQIAQAVAAIANSGRSVTPRLVQGTTPDGITLTDPAPTYTSNQIISQRSADIVRELMVKVVSEGSGRTATPLIGGAGGKTSSAQTGHMEGDKEIVHAWFAGFYPAENPRYSVVVFVEGGESGEHVAAPIFKQIVDGITRMK